MPTPALSTPIRSPLSGRLLSYKILALILATAFVSVLAIGVYVHYVVREGRYAFIRDQIGGYAALVTDQIGTPPDTSMARLMAGRNRLEIRIDGPEGFSWSSTPQVSSPQTLFDSQTLEPIDGNPLDEVGAEEWVGSYDDGIYSIIRIGGYDYTLRLGQTPDTGFSILATIALLLFLLLVLAVAYMFVRRFLEPLKPLMQGVEEVGSGNFEHRVPVTSRDELGQLSRAFNRMARHISDVIASKRRLLFDVSHELRSPLTRMNVALAMLPEGKAKTSIERNVRELNVMITELLENERLAVLGGNLVVEEFDMVTLADQVIDSFGHDTRRIEFDSLTESLMVTADVQRITVALRNLISNALKYSAESDEPVKVTVFPDDDGVRIVVTDHGVGIPVEAQERVFDPFYRTDESRTRSTGGYGLGLSLTKSIIEAHGGTIRLNSTPGVGTTVMAWFPCTPDADAVARPMTAMSSSD